MSAYDYDPDRNALGEKSKNVLPASQFLQERLQERRAKSMRPKRARHTDFGVSPSVLRGRDDDIFLSEAEESRNARMYDSSPIVASARTSDAGGPSSDRRRRAPGVRDMDDQLDRLSKQNFALKLELDHRREQAIKMQGQIDAMTEQVERAVLLEEEHKELLRINGDLVLELEKRDKAVEEAIDHICDLEEQVSDLQERGSNTRPSTAHADSGYAGTETHEHIPASSPPTTAVPGKTHNVNVVVRAPSAEASAASQKLHGLLNTHTPGKPKREPSILSSKKPSTHALRSVYMENSKSLHPVKSFHSLLSKQDNKTDEDGGDLPSSPRLSVLSESSFPSIYSPRQANEANEYNWEAAEEDDNVQFPAVGSRSHMRQDSIKRVSQWISERDMIEATPSKSNNLSAPLDADSERNDGAQHYQSLADALSATAARPDASDPVAEFNKSHPQLRKRKMRGPQPRPTSLAGPMFSDSIYPPTPDSVSTRMLRDSRSSIIGDKSMLDTTPAGLKEFAVLEPGLRTAPRQMRSSVELRSAYNSNLDFRKHALDGSHNDDSSDEEYVRAGLDTGTTVVPVHELTMARHLEYDGFPDGESIKLGTPSRFMSHPKPPSDVIFKHHELSPTLGPRSPSRRRSSEQTISNHPKPRSNRMETSPKMLDVPTGFGGWTDGKSSVESVASPQSVHSHQSGSSSAHTVLPGDDRSQRTLSPGATQLTANLTPVATSPSQPKNALSPARSLGKKMPNLFRRFSSSQGSEREVSPLPTLTSTPSSAYATHVPPRPKTSHTDRTPKNAGGMNMARAPNSRETSRPSLPMRSKIGQSTERPASAAGNEKRSIFRRSNSVKTANAHVTQPESLPEPADRGVNTKRRGSIREVVASRRPWR